MTSPTCSPYVSAASERVLEKAVTYQAPRKRQDKDQSLQGGYHSRILNVDSSTLNTNMKKMKLDSLVNKMAKNEKATSVQEVDFLSLSCQKSVFQ